MNRRKILFISSWFPSKIGPTNGNFVQRHAEAVSTLHQVEILHAVGDFDQKEIFRFDENLVNGIRTLIVYYRNSNNPLKNFVRRMKAYSLGFKKMEKPDLVHANVMHNNMLFAVYLKKKYHIPFVITEHWTSLRLKNHPATGLLVKKTAKFIGNHASNILPVSKELGSGLRKLGIKSKMEVIPNVVDTDLFFPVDEMSDRFTFLHISNLISRKNPEKILSAAISLWNKGLDFRLELGGDGSEEDLSSLKDLLQKSQHQEKAEIFGTLSLREVAARMQRANCFILFSDDENQPCVIGEAFSSGIPVISTDVGGISEFFPENFGVLLGSVVQKDLEQAMLKMINNSNSLSKDQLHQYAEQVFSPKTIAEQFSKIYEKVL